MSNIILLLGASASGKSSIERYLSEAYGFDRVISFTTRQPRFGEKNGIDYHFISEKDFKTMQDNEEFAEAIYYQGSNCWYAAHRFDIQDNSILTTVPEGLRQLKEKENNGELNTRLLSFYIDVSEENRYRRMMSRGDTELSVLRRLEVDKSLFKNIESKVDVVISNNVGESRTKEYLPIFKVLYEAHQQKINLKNFKFSLDHGCYM